jgi:hypothetical protein
VLNLGATVAGTGTDADPYILAQANDILLLAAALNTGSEKALNCFSYTSASDIAEKRAYLQRASYLLVDDINLINTGFMGIGYYTSSEDMLPFNGTFKGNGSNPILTININTQQGNIGLFPVLSNAYLSGFTIAGNINTQGSVVGGIAAYILDTEAQVSYPEVIIENVESRVNIKANGTGSQYLGGFVGRASYVYSLDRAAVTLKGSSFTGSINSKGSYVGGAFGAVESMTQAQRRSGSFGLDIIIEDYSFTGFISSTGAGANNYGGCIGAVLAGESAKAANNTLTKPREGFGIIYNTTSLRVSNCLIGGSIESDASGLGGFASVIEGVDAEFNNVELTGEITGGSGLGALHRQQAVTIK